jgi:hypothetical protein
MQEHDFNVRRVVRSARDVRPSGVLLGHADDGIERAEA